MSQMIHTLDFLLGLKAGEHHELKTRQPEDPPFAGSAEYRHIYNSIKRLNYNQKGKFSLVLRTSRDGLTLAAICTYDGEDRAEVPPEFKRTYKRRNSVAKVSNAPEGAFKPLSFYMQAHHEGKKVEVLDGKAWRSVQPQDWTTIKNENFRVTPIRVAVVWNGEDDQRGFHYDVSNSRVEQLRKGFRHVKVFVEE